MTPKEATEKVCMDCLGLTQFMTKKVEECEGNTALNGACPIYPHRMKGKVSVKKIRRYCLYCQGNSSQSIEECTTFKCSYFQYRFGTNPAFVNKPFKYPS